MAAIPKICRSAKEKVLTAALEGNTGLTWSEYSTHQSTWTAIATPKLPFKASTLRHATCWRGLELQGDADSSVLEQAHQEAKNCTSKERWKKNDVLVWMFVDAMMAAN